MTYHSDEDLQLWVVRGDDDGGWSCPLHARPGQLEDGRVVYLVAPAAFTTNSMGRRVRALLDPISLPGADDRRLIEAEKFRAIAIKAPGITPNFYQKMGSKWEGPKSRVVEFEDEPEVETLKTDLRFIDEVQTKTGVADRETCRLVWAAICQQLPHWLIVKGKPADLGFALLHAVPFRANWKQVLLAKFPTIWTLIKSPADRGDLKLSRFWTALQQSDLLSCIKPGNRKSHIRWSCEVQTKDAWDDYSDEVEQGNAQVLSEQAYLGRVGGLVSRSAARWTAIFRAFVAHTMQPCADVVDDGHGRLERLVPHIPAGRVRPCSVEDPAAAVVSPAGEGQIFPVELAAAPPEKADDLPDLPVVVLHQKGGHHRGHMWATGGVHSSGDGFIGPRRPRGRPRTARVLVQPPPSQPDPGEDVLVDGEG